MSVVTINPSSDRPASGLRESIGEGARAGADKGAEYGYGRWKAFGALIGAFVGMYKYLKSAAHNAGSKPDPRIQVGPVDSMDEPRDRTTRR